MWCRQLADFYTLYIIHLKILQCDVMQYNAMRCDANNWRIIIDSRQLFASLLTSWWLRNFAASFSLWPSLQIAIWHFVLRKTPLKKIIKQSPAPKHSMLDLCWCCYWFYAAVMTILCLWWCWFFANDFMLMLMLILCWWWYAEGGRGFHHMSTISAHELLMLILI